MTKMIAYDAEHVYSVQNEESMRIVFLASPSLLAEVHQATMLYNAYIEHRAKYVPDDELATYVEPFAEGVRYITDIMIDVFGFEATANEQKRIIDRYRTYSLPSLVSKGFLPVEVLAETKGGAHDDVH